MVVLNPINICEGRIQVYHYILSLFNIIFSAYSGVGGVAGQQRAGDRCWAAPGGHWPDGPATRHLLLSW